MFEKMRRLLVVAWIVFCVVLTWPMAAYPQVELVASNPSEGDKFGYSVAVSGDIAVVSARFGDGATEETGTVYVFQRGQGTPDTWTQVRKLESGTENFFEFFGYSVAIDGDTVVVGTIYGESEVWSSGCAYVYQQNWGGTNAWGEVALIYGDDAAGGDKFGSSVAIDGDTIVVGAPGKSDVEYEAGEAYVFERNEGGANAWGQVERLVAGDAGGNRFGAGVAIAGDTVAVGAPELSPSGAVYLFGRDTGGVDSWGEITTLVGSESEPWDVCGYNLGFDGDTLLVGCSGPIGGDGELYVFERVEGSPDLWTETKIIVNPETTGGADAFGTRLSLSGDLAAIGATDPEGCSISQEAVYLFLRNQGGPDNWGLFDTIVLSGGTANNFGAAVALDDDSVVVGATCDGAEAANAGKAYVFDNPVSIFSDGFESGDLTAW